MMRSNNKQSGMTMFSFIVTLLVVGFFVYMGMRLVPPYLDYMNVSEAMDEAATAGTNGRSTDQIWRDFQLKLSFQYADDIVKRDNVKFEKDNDGRTKMHVVYDQKVHFLYNIDFLLHFDHSVVLKGDLGY